MSQESQPEEPSTRADPPQKPHRWRWAPLAVIGALVIALALVAVAYWRDEVAKPIDKGLTDESTLGWPTARPTASPSALPTPSDCAGERLPETPDIAVADLLAAWTGKIQPQRACAARVATPSVVHYISVTGASPDATWPGTFKGCDQLSTIAGIYHCQWVRTNSTIVTLQMRAEAVAGGYIVTAVRIPGPAPTNTVSPPLSPAESLTSVAPPR